MKGKTGTVFHVGVHVTNLKLVCCYCFPPPPPPPSPDTHMKYGVFCLFKVGNQVMDTPSMVEVDRSMMDISLRDTVIL